MPRRRLYIAAYDIVEPKRLHKALRILKGYASGRQKSVFECFLSPYEKRELVAAMDNLLDYEGGDRFLLLQMSTAFGSIRFRHSPMPLNAVSSGLMGC